MERGNAGNFEKFLSTTSDPDEITSLEYGQLKVHYEILNKKFRAAQKTIDQHNFYFKRNSDAFENVIKKQGGSSIPIKSVRLNPAYQVSALHLDSQGIQTSIYSSVYMLE